MGTGNTEVHHSVAESDRTRRHKGETTMWTTILFIAAVILVIAGIVRLVQKDVLWGIILIVLGLLVGPGGVSILS
jgi:hypothetical protein